MAVDQFSPGAVVEVAHPFVRCTFTEYDNDGAAEVASWQPGIRFQAIGPDDSESVADGIGAQIITVVSVHKPGRYPTRVFYTRKWRTPDGKLFGKNALRVLSVAGLTMITRGYRHEYSIAAEPAKE